MSDGSEPTVEEILQSIKQVIARDNRAAAAETRARREAEGLAAARIEPVREAIEARSESLDADVLAEAGEFLGETDSAESEDALISDETQASMRDSLAALAMLSEPGAAPKIVRSGETSVEDLMRELLRPALAEWLDKNLPAVVERMVAAEIRRASGRKD
jgi:hypothetical protein